MKDPEFIKKNIEESQQIMLACLLDLKEAIALKDWETVIQYANGIIVGACTMQVANDILED